MATWGVANATLARGVPTGVVLSGVVFGSLDALVAAGIVLVYRSSRVLNFAQAQVGAVAAVLSLEFIFRWHWPYPIAVVAGVAMGAASGALVESSVVRRLRRAPRLIVAVATIGVAQVLDGVAVLIPLKWSGPTPIRFRTPFQSAVHWRVFPYVFNGDYVVATAVSASALTLLSLFLLRTRAGVAIRAAADNSDRAELLGVPVQRLQMTVWAIAGALSAITVVLRVPIVGFSSFESVSSGGLALLLHAFAAAVLGGTDNIARTAAAAIGLGVVTEAAAWTFGNSVYVDALLLVVILAALLTRRDRFRRATETGIGEFAALREVRPVPAELRDTREVRLGIRALRVVVIAAAVGFPLVATPSQDQSAGLVLIYAMVAVSLVVLTGWGGHISLGQFALVGFGAATTGTLVARHGWDLFAALTAGVALATAASVMIGLPALRVRGPFLAVTTLAFAVTSSTFFLSPRLVPWFVTEDVERPALWRRLPIEADWQMYYVCLVGLLAVFAVARGVRASRSGRALIASRDNPVGAQALAISTVRVHVAGFALSGAICGFAGGLFVLHQHGVHGNAFAPEISLELFAMVVIGGLGSLPGALLGAIYVRGAELFLPHGWSAIASGAGLVALLVAAPGGLSELMYRGRDELLRRIAARHNILVPSLVADARRPDAIDDAERVGL